MKEKNTNKGITLIALVITIIVMLILVAVTISMAVNGGLFEYASNAGAQTNAAVEAEQKFANLEANMTVDELIDKYTSKGNEDHFGIIPAGGIYTIASTSEVLREGDAFPETVGDGDVYTFGDYEYKYNYSWLDTWRLEWINISEQNGWGVHVIDTTKDKYDNILNSIARCPITCMSYAYIQCTKLVSAPKIPENVNNMNHAFCGCSSLKNAPKIPEGVQNLNQAFHMCTSLHTAPVIPKNVTDLNFTFCGCTVLTGMVTINANELTAITRCFFDTTKPIILTGSSTKLAEIAATANNGNVQVAE